MSRLSVFRWSPATSVTLAGVFLVPLAPASRPAVPIPPALYSALTWRNIGPFRGGRVAAVTGAIGEPGVFYAGLPAGGVWKTTSAGETWYPVFDSVKDVASVGAVDVAPSNPDIVYAGTGDLITGGGINEGNGVYKSTDAGKTWTHVGLDATKQIPSLLVDPRDHELVLVAAQGDIHRRSDQRGVFRSADGGRTWTKTLYVDDETGIQKLARAFDVPDVIFATTVRHYTPPIAPSRRTSEPDTGRTGTALYKSTDNGLTWREISGGGLPRLAGRTSVAVAMNTGAQRVFLIGNFGLYRSDDGGTSWHQMAADDERIRNGQGGYNCGVYVDPKNPDVVYTISTSSYKSSDGGKTFTGFKGAPGGDDPQQMWIDPTNGQRIFLGLDQGATISLDGGRTWSSWYNQSTEQVYHLSVDNSFPYWVYATQQDAGAVRSHARGILGEITPLDWSPVPGWEWGTIVPDPLDPNVVYASGSGIVKITYPSQQWINVSPSIDPSTRLRTTSSQPLVWAPWNQHELLAGFQSLMATTDGGVHWKSLSPDLTLAAGTDNATAGATFGRGNAIETISASTVTPGLIWVGTSNGRLALTRNHGKSWSDVTIAGLPNPTRAFISGVDASHSDAATAYVAIDYHGTGDYTPYFYRTHDFGRTWTKIVDGLPTDQASGSFARVIRADPKKPGLLFAGTESSFYVSFDDGDHWQSLMQNLPNTSYRDVAIKGNDLVVGTYGRGIWVLDDYTLLRQLTPAIATEPAHLFAPASAVRLRRNLNADTPFPPEVPHALNPPDGVIISYSLGARPTGDITLEVKDSNGRVVRHLSSAPMAAVVEAARPPEPNFWLATPSPLPTAVGTNRVNWDLRYDAPPAFTHSFEINANPGLTPASPEGPLAMPGTYVVVLTVNGRSYTQPVTVLSDPQSPASHSALVAENALLMKLYDDTREAWSGYEQAAALRTAAEKTKETGASTDVAAAAASLVAKIDSVAGNPEGGRAFRGRASAPTFVSMNGAFLRQLGALDYGDMAPTAPMLAAYASTHKELDGVQARWKNVVAKDLVAFNSVLTRNGMPALMVSDQPVSATRHTAR